MKKSILLILVFFGTFSFAQNLQMSACGLNETAFFDLTEFVYEYTGGQDPVSFTVSYHNTQSDANDNINPIGNPENFQNLYNPQIIFVRAINNSTNEITYSILSLTANNQPLVQPLVMTSCTMIEPNEVYFSTDDIVNTITSNYANTDNYNVNLYYDMQNDVPVINDEVYVGLNENGNGYMQIYYAVTDLQTGCVSDVEAVELFAENCFMVYSPNDLTACSVDSQACFDLTENTNTMTGGNTSLIVSFYSSEADATANTNPITNPSEYCITDDSDTICARVYNTVNETDAVLCFELLNTSYIDSTSQVLEELYTCDDNGDGIAIIDLTTAELAMNSPVSVAYYGSPVVEVTTQINSPNIHSLSTFNPTSFVFALASYSDSCPVLYRLEITAYATCNNAYVCEQANSLCSALGEPFVNTFQGVQAEEGNDYGCLSTQPNPTWFYLPVSSDGDLSFLIEQNTSIDFNGQGLDVDFVCYGPFSSPTTPCNTMLTDMDIVDCSYSASAVEDVNISNAVVGEYYLIMVTNFSGSPGFIRINEIGQGANSGSLDCSGFNLLAFLDANGNGIQDAGEPNFPLGVFNYEMNSNGTVNNITNPTGSHSIYEDDATVSYDFGYSVLSEYADFYSLATSSYTNQMISTTGGMTTLLFPVTPVQDYTDVASYIVPLSPPMPGFTYTNRIFYGNLGTATVPSGVLNFENDATVTILSISEPSAVLTTTGFTFTYTDLLPFEYRFIDVEMTVPVLPIVNLGDLLTNTVSVTPFNSDVNTINNVQSNTQIVIGSYDPNDKMESHGPEIVHADFEEDDYLFYTIRFQNSGTASAVNVRVEDYLNSMFDEESIRMIQSSHDYTLDRVDNHLVWSFKNIQLPHEGVSYELSQGYVYFKIKLKPGFEVGDIVPNGASIYFDFNPPIITNTFNTTFTENLSTPLENLDAIKVYPNPLKDNLNITLSADKGMIKEVVITNMVGDKIKVFKTEELTEVQVSVSDLATGVYLIQITTTNNNQFTQKMVKK